MEPGEWTTSSFCKADEPQCVKVMKSRDGDINLTDIYGDAVIYSPTEWTAFIQGVKNGEFDL